MKKLMIAAAVAAMTAGAFAECAEEVKCPFGYQIKVMVKTTEPVILTYKVSECEDGTECVRNPTTRRFAGFIYGTTEATEGDCDEFGCDCNEWDGATLSLWDYDNKADAKVAEWTLLQLDRVWNQANDRTTFEIAFDLDGLRFAGFGKVDLKDGKWTIKNASGFCAGQLNQKCKSCVYDESECEETCDETPVTVWNICVEEAVESETTIAYGKWTLVWDSKVAEYVRTNKPLEISGWEPVAEPVTIGGAN